MHLRYSRHPLLSALWQCLWAERNLDSVQREHGHATQNPQVHDREWDCEVTAVAAAEIGWVLGWREDGTGNWGTQPGTDGTEVRVNGISHETGISEVYTLDDMHAKHWKWFFPGHMQFYSRLPRMCSVFQYIHSRQAWYSSDLSRISDFLAVRKKMSHSALKWLVIDRFLKIIIIITRTIFVIV